MTSEQLPAQLGAGSPAPAPAPAPTAATRRELGARWLVVRWPALALATLVAVLFDLLSGGVLTTVVDPWVREHLAALPHTGPDLAVAHVLDHTGKITVVTPVVAAAAAWASWRRRSWTSVMMALGTLFWLLAALAVLKFGLARGLAVNGDPSLFVPGGQAFPSGHAAQAAAAAGLLVALLPRALGRPLRRSTALLVVLLPCSVMTVVSLYLGFHWTTDLVAGTLAGLLAVRAGLALEARVERRADERRIGVPPLDLFLGTAQASREPFDARDDGETVPGARPGAGDDREIGKPLPRSRGASASVAA